MLAIPRGIIYHTLIQEFGALFRVLGARLNRREDVAKFENEFARYMGQKYCVAFPFARTAMYFSLKLKKIPPGSEIIMPPITIKGILDVVLELKLKPVFVDIDLENLCFDTQQLKQKITPDTRAIIITYLYGIVPNVDELMRISRENNLFVIEDFSHNLNARFRDKKLGTFGDVGVYSSSSVKTLDTFGGGLLVTNDPGLYEGLRGEAKMLKPTPRMVVIKKIGLNLVRNIATTRVGFALFTFPFLRIMKKLFPADIMKYSGTRGQDPVSKLPPVLFYSYTSFQARIGSKLLEKVSELDKERVKNVMQIKESTENLAVPKGDMNGQNVYWQFVFYAKEPNGTQDYFHSRNIDTATTSLEHISHLKNYQVRANTPNAERLYNRGLFIPSYPGLNDKDIKRISEVVSGFRN